MKSGDIVKVYEDPVTCLKLEGEAKILDVPDSTRDIVYCMVKFISDGFITHRWIKRGCVDEKD